MAIGRLFCGFVFQPTEFSTTDQPSNFSGLGANSPGNSCKQLKLRTSEGTGYAVFS
jgi:hypothetical protein